MNANDLTFGIEIETIAPDSAVRNDGLRIGPYKHGIQVPVPARRLDGRSRRLDRQQQRGPQMRDRKPDPPGRRRPGPGRRGPANARGQRPPGQRELRGPRSRRLEARIGPARPWPAWSRSSPTSRRASTRSPGSKNRERGPVLRRGPQVRKRQGRQAEPRPQPLPRLEPHQPRPRDEGHGRVPGLLRIAQRGEGGRLDSGLPGIGRAGHEREADADLDPEAAHGRMEEGRPRPERGGTPDRATWPGARATPGSTAASSTDGSRTPFRRTRSRPSSAAWPRSTTPQA